MAEEICHRLHFSNEEIKQIMALVANHMRFGDVEKMKESTLKRFMRLPKFDEHMELHRIDCLSSHRSLGMYDFVRDRLEHTPTEEIRPPALLNGRGSDRARLQARSGIPCDPFGRRRRATGGLACAARKKLCPSF